MLGLKFLNTSRRVRLLPSCLLALLVPCPCLSHNQRQSLKLRPLVAESTACRPIFFDFGICSLLCIQRPWVISLKSLRVELVDQPASLHVWFEPFQSRWCAVFCNSAWLVHAGFDELLSLMVLKRFCEGFEHLLLIRPACVDHLLDCFLHPCHFNNFSRARCREQPAAALPPLIFGLRWVPSLHQAHP